MPHVSLSRYMSLAWVPTPPDKPVTQASTSPVPPLPTRLSTISHDIWRICNISAADAAGELTSQTVSTEKHKRQLPLSQTSGATFATSATAYTELSAVKNIPLIAKQLAEYFLSLTHRIRLVFIARTTLFVGRCTHNKADISTRKEALVCEISLAISSSV